ncbi:ABC transporter permease [Luteolibacter soli]|uniref:Iron ABC transporter permease n=1 Tax=Luteolibacter soli TaxID=3135280 RepID=A0ABU9ANU6_9BACT
MNRGAAIAVTAVVTALFGVFFLYPAFSVIGEAFRTPGGGFTMDFIGDIFKSPIYREGLWNALALGVVSTLATFLIAFPLSLLSYRYDFLGRGVLGVLILIPLVLPPFVGAIGIRHMLGVEGSLNALLTDIGLMNPQAPVDWLAKGRFWGIVAMNALHLYPILYMNITAALSNLDPAMEQAAENLGCPPARRLLRITLPLAMPGIFAGSAIVFVWAFTELGVPLVFDFTRVAPVQVFDGIKDLSGNPAPYALVAVILVISALVFGVTKALFGRQTSGAQPRPKGRGAEVKLTGLKSLGCAMIFGAVFVVASLPHLGVILLSLSDDWYQTVLPVAMKFDNYRDALGDPFVVPSIKNSLFYASFATLVDLVLGVAIAWVIVRSTIKGRALLDALVMLPLAVPGLVLAFGYLALSQEGRPLRFLIGAGGNPAMLLIVAYAVRRLPYVVRSAVAGLQQSNPALEEAARSLGAGWFNTLRKVSLPLIGANLAAGCILAFAFAMLEVSDSLILAQQVEYYPITKTIYSLLSSLGNGHELAAALGTWAMVFLSIAIVGAAALGGKRGGLFRV